VGSGVGTGHVEGWDAGMTGFELAYGEGVESGIRSAGSWVDGIATWMQGSRSRDEQV
jgi:hypothetical protein